MPRLQFKHWPIRRKLLAMVLMPLVVVLPLLGMFLLIWGNAAVDQLLVAKVRADLAVARSHFDRMLTDVGGSAAAMADSRALSDALDGVLPVQGSTQAVRSDQTRAHAQDLPALLRRLRDRERLDFIQFRSADAQLLAGADSALQTGAAAAQGPALPWVPPTSPRPQGSVEVLSATQQAALPQALRARVAVPLLVTANAAPSAQAQEDRAMVVMATADVRGPDGQLRGHLQAGVLLNRNLGFIDQLNEVVYPDGALPQGSHGTATLFLDDVRISTNVRLFGGEASERAIGTRVSSTVREAVLGRGDTWLDRAFVVKDWYVSGYLPLTDHLGRRVGMLYVGFLEAPFVGLKYIALATIGLIFFAVMLVAGWVSLRWARGIFHPLEQMSRTIIQLEAGDSQARVGAVNSRDEIGELAAHFDHLLDTLDQRTDELQALNQALDAKVAQRTAALASRTLELETAQQQLVRAEKLAAIGQLTAGIAHEVNNPIAVIQGNLDLARELLGPHARLVRDELTLMDQQIERMRLIVTRLLQFARPGDYAGYVDTVDAAKELRDCLPLVEHLLRDAQVQVHTDWQHTRSAQINRQELQQVLVNLLVNALQAMPEGGELRLSTADWAELGVEIRVEDTGPGVPAELLNRLFQPFATGRNEGTGLGLWISHSLVERYGGELQVINLPGRGARVSLRLRSEVGTLPALAAPQTV
ncbi:MAG: two-component sensor histidine kinase [Burkholderiales bacterium PBB6]|nr:MAG: two-component sensor histidine kinase [Burkholderiales bacterium PBB6]